MASYLTPGVYVQEVSTGTKPIGAVGTSTVAFLGALPIADAHLGEAIACNNWSQFVKEFVGEDGQGTTLARAVYGFFMNGGGRCYIVNVPENDSIAGDARKRTGLHCLEQVDEVAIVAAPGRTDLASHQALISHCELLEDRVAILDAPSDVSNTDTLKVVATAAPSAGAGEGEDAAKPSRQGGGSKGVRPPNSSYAAFYFPWITVRDPFSASELVSVPPSGHLAGIYARNDATRGVHKAPANEPIRGALGLSYRVTREEQGELNRAGVNCIRYFPDAGINVWGARTLDGDSSEWKYINVRRLFNMVKESIAEGTRWTVFEPNDMTLWKSISRDVKAFLTLLWRDGALMGAAPEEAFFVKCDAETNSPEVIDAGRVVIEIGICPVKPAEFVIFRIGQWSGGSDVETASEA